MQSPPVSVPPLTRHAHRLPLRLSHLPRPADVRERLHARKRRLVLASKNTNPHTRTHTHTHAHTPLPSVPRLAGCLACQRCVICRRPCACCCAALVGDVRSAPLAPTGRESRGAVHVVCMLSACCAPCDALLCTFSPLLPPYFPLVRCGRGRAFPKHPMCDWLRRQEAMQAGKARVHVTRPQRQRASVDVRSCPQTERTVGATDNTERTGSERSHQVCLLTAVHHRRCRHRPLTGSGKEVGNDDSLRQQSTQTRGQLWTA